MSLDEAKPVMYVCVCDCVFRLDVDGIRLLSNLLQVSDFYLLQTYQAADCRHYQILLIVTAADCYRCCRVA